MIIKQGVDIPFAQGLDTKSDPKRVQMGKFLQLENSVFTKAGLLQKRNGFGRLPSIQGNDFSYLTTFNQSLTAIGQGILSYAPSVGDWIGGSSFIQPLSLSVNPVLRNNLNQTACDSAVAPNGAVCTVYLQSDGATTKNYYAVSNPVTGQNISPPALIPVSGGIVDGGMRVFVLGNNFIIVFTNTFGGTHHLQYVTVNIINPFIVSANIDIAAAYTPATALSWDGYVAAGNLYLAYDTISGGQAVKVTYLTPTLAQNALAPVAPVSFAAYTATVMSVTADPRDPVTGQPLIYVSFYNSGSSTGYTLAVNAVLNTVMAPQEIISSGTVLNLASTAQQGGCTVFVEVAVAYSWDAAIATNRIDALAVIGSSASVTPPYTVIRGMGLASKAFIVKSGTNGTIYFLAAYQSPYQSTYFLIDGSSSFAAQPAIAAKLAYENGGGYLTLGLPSVTVTGNVAKIAYLYKDLIAAVSKNTNAQGQVNGIYSQTGINLAAFTIGTQSLDTAEIGGDLHISGGFLWMYDGSVAVEHNFFLWPDSYPGNVNQVTTSAAGGSLAAQVYFYQWTYEWTDNQGNAFRSAPSIPMTITTTGATSSNTLNIPYLRATMKTANPVKIVIYRWSTAQQIYYQVTSITAPRMNLTTSDSLQFVDTLSDAAILGNNIIYTNGGVVEDVNAPATDVMTLFDTRLFLVDAEDRNLLWFSKQVIESTPVEMSDLFTVYIPPTTSTEGSTGPISALAAMDDKLIIFKENAIYYINGTGPDNTGSTNQYSPPIFVTSTVGCTIQKSIVLTPKGLMFQSNKGIWLLDRGLNTSYLGAPVEKYNASIVNSAVNIPATNQTRFTLSTGEMLMYDYYYDQWATFAGVPAVSSCIFDGMHTFVNASEAVYQETPDSYLDGTNPVLMMFQTGPLRLGDLQNYQRAYFFYLLGSYISPHRLVVSVSYDYGTNPSQTVIISPTNYSPPFGSGASQSPFGQGTPFGGPTSLECWRVFLERQRCMAFGIQVQEIYDPTIGPVAGAGLTLSGINVVMGFKKAFRPQPAAQTVG